MTLLGLRSRDLGDWSLTCPGVVGFGDADGDTPAAFGDVVQREGEIYEGDGAARERGFPTCQLRSITVFGIKQLPN